MKRRVLLASFLLVYFLAALLLLPILTKGLSEREEFCYFESRNYQACVEGGKP